MDVEEQPVPLPSAPSRSVGPNLTIQPPLSRRGHGPGLLLVCAGEAAISNPSQDALDPAPMQKWAEEGYAIARVTLPVKEGTVKESLEQGVAQLKELEECDTKDKFGLIIYDTNVLAPEDRTSIDAVSDITAVVSYGPAIETQKPQIAHLPTNIDAPTSFETLTVHKYPDVKSAHFVTPGHADYNGGSAAVSHTRTLKFLKPQLDGPYFDLEAIWDEHAFFEFGERNVAKTMGTMVQEPYVNHIPTMTGGIGRGRLQNFYRYHFIFNNPADINLEIISRTLGIDRVIDEFVCTFTHTEMIDWLLPGIPPTHKSVRLPAVSVVNVRGDRLYHEHIWWDQASLLVQLGLMPEYLPFPYALPDGRTPGSGRRFEYRVPAAGQETARKLEDENSVESNQMMSGAEIREVEDK